MNSHYDALLFDFDGVLADSEPYHHRAWLDVVEPLGISLTWDYYRANCVGISDDALVRDGFGIKDPTEAASWVEHKRASYRAALEASPPFLPQTVELIRELSSHYRLAVVSSSARVEVEPPLTQAGLRECFRLFITFEDVINVKPAPEPYVKAASLLGATRPLVIEDSPAGIAAARAAGFDVVCVSSPGEMVRQVRARLVAAAGG